MKPCGLGVVELEDSSASTSQKPDVGAVLPSRTASSVALRYLHSQTPTIVHRDLKSLNVVLDLSLNIKVGPAGTCWDMGHGT